MDFSSNALCISPAFRKFRKGELEERTKDKLRTNNQSCTVLHKRIPYITYNFKDNFLLNYFDLFCYYLVYLVIKISERKFCLLRNQLSLPKFPSSRKSTISVSVMICKFMSLIFKMWIKWTKIHKISSITLLSKLFKILIIFTSSPPKQQVLSSWSEQVGLLAPGCQFYH